MLIFVFSLVLILIQTLKIVEFKHIFQTPQSSSKILHFISCFQLSWCLDVVQHGVSCLIHYFHFMTSTLCEHFSCQVSTIFLREVIVPCLRHPTIILWPSPTEFCTINLSRKICRVWSVALLHSSSNQEEPIQVAL